MPASFVKCVDDLLKQGKDKSSAYAICTVSYKKTHKGHTPQQDEKKSKAASDMVTLAEIKAMGQFYEEVDAARKKKKLTKKDMQDMMDEQMKTNNPMKGMGKQ